MPAATSTAICELGLAMGTALVRSIELVGSMVLVGKTVLVESIVLVGTMVLCVGRRVAALVMAWPLMMVSTLMILITFVMPAMEEFLSVVLNHEMMVSMALVESWSQQFIILDAMVETKCGSPRWAGWSFSDRDQKLQL